MWSQVERIRDTPPVPAARTGFSLEACLAVSAALHLGLLIALGTALSDIRKSDLAAAPQAVTAARLLVRLPHAMTDPAAPPHPAMAGNAPLPTNPAAPASVAGRAKTGIGPLSRLPELVEGIPETILVPGDPPVSGQVRLVVGIDRSGNATYVRVLQSNLPRAVEAEIVSHFYRARYRPGETDGRPVESTMEVGAEFNFDGAGAGPSGKTLSPREGPPAAAAR